MIGDRCSLKPANERLLDWWDKPGIIIRRKHSATLLPQTTTTISLRDTYFAPGKTTLP